VPRYVKNFFIRQFVTDKYMENQTIASIYGYKVVIYTYHRYLMMKRFSKEEKRYEI